MDHWDVFWGRWNLYRKDGLHLNWRVTNILGRRFARALWEGLNYCDRGVGTGILGQPPISRRETEELISSQILEKCEKSMVVVVGDFNFPPIDWDSLRAKGSDGEQFVSCVQEGSLRQDVDNPTREETILDLVLGNEPGQ
eukprot:g22004.t1